MLALPQIQSTEMEGDPENQDYDDVFAAELDLAWGDDTAELAVPPEALDYDQARCRPLLSVVCIIVFWASLRPRGWTEPGSKAAPGRLHHMHGRLASSPCSAFRPRRCPQNSANPFKIKLVQFRLKLNML